MFGSKHSRGRAHRRNAHAFPASSSASAKSPSPESLAKRIRLRLEELGPEYSCLGLYLASRIDVLPPEYWRELALIPDSAAPVSPSTVKRLLQQELGNQAERAFLEFDYSPENTTLLSQQHRAQLRTGTPVAVAVLHPRFPALPAEPGAASWNTVEITDLFAGLLTPDVLADFAAVLRRKTNFQLAREGLELLDRDAASCDILRSYKPYGELCTNRVLTFQLDEPAPEPIGRHQTRAPAVLASRLCHVWLQQALRGHCFPVDPQLQTTYVDGNNQIVFVDCDLVGLPESAKKNLANYFDAILADDPDKAATHLLHEMVPSQPAMKLDADGFRSSFRQAAYFGALGPILGTDSNALAQQVFQHWKTALAFGYAPKPHLLCFYRGLFSMARVARHVSPEGDPLRKGLEELRTVMVFDQLGEITNWRYWFQSSDKFASAMINLPRTIDKALTKASGAPGATLPQERSGPARPRPAGSMATVIVLLVLLVVTSQLSVAHGWSGKIVSLALMLAGLLALREAFD